MINNLYGGIPEMGVPPVIIHFDRIFHYKPTILDIPIFGNTHIPLILIGMIILRQIPQVIFLDIDGVLNRTRAATHIRLDEDLMLLLKER